MKNVVTYRNIYQSGVTMLCTDCVNSKAITAAMPALGAVTRGAHAGDCDGCVIDAKLRKYGTQTAADMGDAYMAGVRSMRDNSFTVAIHLSIDASVIIAWADEQMPQAKTPEDFQP